MPTSRWFHGSAVVDGKIYVIGGGWLVPNNENEVYDPSTDSWETLAPMPTPRGALSVCAVEGKIFALGGFNGNNIVFNTNEMYDPETDSWSSRKIMPTERVGLATAVIEGKIYAIGGTFNNFNSLNKVEIYDPDNNTWENGPTLQRARFGLAAAGLDSIIIAVGGTRSNEMPAYGYAEVFNVNEMKWRYVDPVPTATQWTAGCILGSRFYLLGGEDKCCMTFDDAVLLDKVYSIDLISDGINENSKGLCCNVYPNPFRQKTVLTMEIKEKGSGILQVYNSCGMLVHKQDLINLLPGKFSVQLDAESWRPGIYHAVLRTGETSGTARLVKIK